MSLKMYSTLAAWYPLLTDPEDYVDEAKVYGDLLMQSATRPVRDVLELGCGAGANASHMKARFNLTLSDLSEDMLKLSRALNPELPHHLGDMRSLRLSTRFDAVFVHDAVVYLTTEDDLRQAMQTAFEHLRPGGCVVFAPDFIEDTFEPDTESGGHGPAEGPGKAVRYLSWDHRPAPNLVYTDYSLMLRDGDHMQLHYDRHVCGLFSRATWLRLLESVGFVASDKQLVFELEEDQTSETVNAFMGLRPGL